MYCANYCGQFKHSFQRTFRATLEDFFNIEDFNNHYLELKTIFFRIFRGKNIF